MLEIERPTTVTPNNQEQRNADAIEMMRAYFLKRIDDIQGMIANGVTKEDLRVELDRIHRELVGVREGVDDQVDGVKGDVKTIIARIDVMEDNIVNRQKESRNRIIYVQSTVLLAIITSIIGLVIQFLFHH